MKNTLLPSIFFLLLTTVHADDFLDDLLDDPEQVKDHTGWYVGAKLGQMSTEMSFSNTPYTTEIDTPAGGMYFGYNFSSWFGLETEFSYTADAGNGLFIDGVVEYADYGGLRLQPKFTWQINDSFGLIFKGGLYSASYSIEPTEAAKVKFGLESIEYWSGAGLTLGVGAQFSITNNLNIRAVYDTASIELEYEGDADISDIDAVVNEYSLGLHYQF